MGNGFTSQFSKAYTQSVSGAFDSSGEFFPLDSCAQNIAKNSSGQVTQIDATDGVNTWRQTYTYTAAGMAISMWVKQ